MRSLRLDLVSCLLLLSCVWPTMAFHPNEVDTFECQVCGPLTFCEGGAEFGCPSNSLSNPTAFPSEIAHCICNPGYLREGDICSIGRLPHYYYEGLQQTCPIHKLTTANLSSTILDCVCENGFAAQPTWEGICVECGHGTYNPSVNSTVCASCPPDSSHTLKRQTTITSCECDPGFTGNNGEACAVCAAGKFKGESGDADCQNCLENQYSNGTGAVLCSNCDPNSLAPPGSNVDDDCKCKPGYEVVDGANHACQACSPGFAKSSTENEACIVCSTGFYADVGTLFECKSCGNHSQHSPVEAPVLCLCDPGFFLEADSAEPTSADACVSCAPNSFKTSVSNLQSDCQSCPDENMVSAAGSDDRLDCRCKAGYTEGATFDGTCEQCGAGEYKDFVGSGETPSACQSCPANTISVEGATQRTQCVCQAGFEGSVLGETCTACPLGKFKADIGTEACSPCPQNKYQNETAQLSCKSCHATATSPEGSDGINDCLCPAGSARQGTEDSPVCVSCGPGTFSDPANGGECANCSLGTYSVAYGTTSCLQCLGNSSSYEVPRVACQCDLGFRCLNADLTCNDGNCVACEKNTFKDTVGGAATCDPCHLNSVSPRASTSQDACLCKRGYEQVDTGYGCDACAGGTYSDALNSEECHVCKDDTPHTYTPSSEFPYDELTACTACTLCPDGSFFNTEGGCGGVQGTDDITCQTCLAAGLVTGTQATTESATAGNPNFGEDSCKCNAGFTVGNTGTSSVTSFTTEGVTGDRYDCTACEVGYYRSGLGVASCNKCPTHTTTLLSAATLRDNCLCGLGAGLSEDDVCEECQADFYKPDVANVTCSGCWPFSGTNSGVGSTSCQCKPGYIFPTAQANALASDDYDSLTCQACEGGKFSSIFTLGSSCNNCGVDTFAQTGASVCSDCGHHSSTLNLTTQSICLCDQGFQRFVGFEGVNPDECRTCTPGTFKSNPLDENCGDCTAFCGEDERVQTFCTEYDDLVCESCQNNSNKATNLLETGPCNCDAGFELQGDLCEECAVGKSRSTNNNNTILCQTCEGYTFQAERGAIECQACSLHCPTLEEGASERKYVTQDCQPASDIVCSPCTICESGKYAETFCGPSHDNNRNDSVCKICEAGQYCTNQQQLPCPANTFSLAGNGNPLCTCLDGYYRDENDDCVKCGHGFYCFDEGRNACPGDSLTHTQFSTHRLDCHCKNGHYRFPVNDTTAFNCAACLPNDWCFNNTHNNCTDERMTSPSGSFHISNCTCADGWYNSLDDTECVMCPVDHYCFEGRRFECSNDRWTQGENNLLSADACVCRPGTFGNTATHTDIFSSPVMPSCGPCDNQFYCLGTDNTQTPCPSNSSTEGPGADERIDCKCVQGFQPIGSTPHACEECITGKFKTNTGNVQCSNCTYCSSDTPAFLYHEEVCSSTQNAVCDACDACTNGTTFIDRHCQDFLDTECSTCGSCDLTEQFIRKVCTLQNNIICNNITKTQCTEYDLNVGTVDSPAIGYYRGGHTTNTNSKCLPCQSRHIPYYGNQLHAFSTAGVTYNDPYSCDVVCLGASKRRDVNNASLGCETCETGNVLLKDFTSDGLACSFECRPGYVYDARYDDCILQRYEVDYNLNLEIINYNRIAFPTESGWKFSIYHSNHSHYIVVVGGSSPTACHSTRTCCWQNHWRVSQSIAMGTLAMENCSQANVISFEQVDPTHIDFSIPDSRLDEIASCSEGVDGNTICSLTVSIIDTVRYNVVSRMLSINTFRGMDIIHVNQAHTYIPLENIHVVVLPLFTKSNGATVYSVSTTIKAGAYGLNVTHRVRDMTRYSTALGEKIQCPRISSEGETGVKFAFQAFQQRVFHSRWEGMTSIVHNLYGLETLSSFTDSKSIVGSMDIAALQNLTGMGVVCESSALRNYTFQGGEVYATAGMGAHAIYSMRRLTKVDSALNTTQGALGNLLTFLGRANTGAPNRVTMKSLLAVYSKHSAVNTYVVSNITRVVSGELDFTEAFRQWCQASTDCQYEYVNRNPTFSTTFTLTTCSTTEKLNAQAWVTERFGIPHDNGHVDALCIELAKKPELASSATLVHTMAYLDRRDQDWKFQRPIVTRTLAWAMFAFETI